jgi:hypothetical protein
MRATERRRRTFGCAIQPAIEDAAARDDRTRISDDARSCDYLTGAHDASYDRRPAK